MIKIKDNLYLDAKGLDYQLLKRQVTKESGKVYYITLGYYPSIKFVIRAAAERQLMDFISHLDDIESVYRSA